MAYKQCSRCKEFYNYGTGLLQRPDCGCKEFTVVDEDGEEHDLYASDPEKAALRFTKIYNSDGDYSLMNETLDIEVQGPDGVKRFIIGAEPDIYYFANEKSS